VHSDCCERDEQRLLHCPEKVFKSCRIFNCIDLRQVRFANLDIIQDTNPSQRMQSKDEIQSNISREMAITLSPRKDLVELGRFGPFSCDACPGQTLRLVLARHT